MAIGSDQETPTPTFSAPMAPAGYVRRMIREPHQVTEPVTPQDALFVLAHLGIPRVDPAAWRLDIAGLVQRPEWPTLADIRSLPVREIESFHQCAGAPRRPDLAMRRIANLVWSGVDPRRGQRGWR